MRKNNQATYGIDGPARVTRATYRILSHGRVAEHSPQTCAHYADKPRVAKAANLIQVKPASYATAFYMAAAWGGMFSSNKKGVES